MKISYELDLDTFEAWSGAVSTLDRVRNEGKTRELESILDDSYPDGMTETELNDLLWFNSEEVYEWLGLRVESQVQEELEEAKEELADKKEELEDLLGDYNSECEDASRDIREEIWEDYKDDYEALQQEIKEIEDTIRELEEEYAAL